MNALLLAATAAASAAWLAFAPASDQLRRDRLPADVDFVVHLDVEGLRQTTLWKHLEEGLAEEDVDIDDLEEFKTRYGIDPFTDVRALTLFKVKAEFTTEMDRSTDNEQAYALFVATITQQDGTLPFDRSAVARVVEHGSRLASDQMKLSTRFGEIADLIREAAHGARQAGQSVVSGASVQVAEADRRYRQNLWEERLQADMHAGTLLIELQRSRDNGPVWRAATEYKSIDKKRIDAETASAVKLLISKYPPPKS